MKIIEGDLLEVKDGIIAHQCNCRGAFGVGIALRIRRKWPTVFVEYQKAFRVKQLILGELNIVKVTGDLHVVNLLGQDRYGRGSRMTDYNAVAQAFGSLHKLSVDLNKQVYIPYLMGCVNAGGNWEVYSKIVDTHCPNTIAVRLKLKTCPEIPGLI